MNFMVDNFIVLKKSITDWQIGFILQIYKQ